MWISRKEYKFLKEIAEKNINAECEILAAKEKQMRSVARAMEEYSSVLKERDMLKQRVMELEGRLGNTQEYEYPCTYCDTGWGSISSEGCTSCADTCDRLKQYCKNISNLRGKL